MNFNAFLSSLFGGNKATRDRKAIQPLVEEALAVYATLAEISNDELRAKTRELQNDVQHSADDIKGKNRNPQGQD